MKLIKFPLKNDKTPACKHWKTHALTDDEAKNSNMLGTIVPKGVFIIDVDLYKGVTLEDIEHKLECKIPWRAAKLQETLRGGEHYGFRIDGDIEMRQGTNLLDIEGFDSRSAGKAYLASGKGYKDLTILGLDATLSDPNLLPELPDNAIELLRTKKVDTAVSDLADIIEKKPIEGINLDDVKLYVNRLTAEQSADSHTWLRVGMGIYHQTEGSEDGWAIFDEFSKKAPEKYDRTMNRTRWGSFGRESGSRIKFPTVIQMAGGKNTAGGSIANNLKTQLENCKKVEDIEKIIKKISTEKLDPVGINLLLKDVQAAYKIICGKAPTLGALKQGIRKLQRIERNGEFIKDYVFLTSCNQFMHIENKSTMDTKGFNIAYNRETPFSADGIPIDAVKYAEKSIKCVEDGMYAPMFDTFFIHVDLTYINLYKKVEIDDVQAGTTDIVDRVIKHIEHILVNKAERRIFTEYLAHNIQFPGKKINWAIVLQGVQGDGKSFFAEMMQHTLGYQNIRIMNAETLEGAHTGWAGGQCMTFIEELKLDNYRKYSILNKLKPYIANPSVECRALYKNPRVIMNTTNYIAFSNYTDSLPLDINDRRYCILFSQWQNRSKLLEFMKKNSNYYPNLYDDMRKHFAELYNWLKNYKISNQFLAYKNAPMTDSKNKMISESINDNTLIVQDAIIKFDCEDINDQVINITKLVKLINEDFDSDMRNFPKTAALKHSLRELGYQSVGIYKNNERQNQRIYAKDLFKKALDFKT